MSPRFSIITPTILRVTADRTMESVDRQLSENYEHIVMVDGPEYGSAPLRWVENPRRVILYCAERHNDCGATCRHNAWGYARGEYILYLDDDDYYIPEAITWLDGAIVDEPFGVFPILNGGLHSLHLPPGPCRTASCQLYHRRTIAREQVSFPAGRSHYAADSEWAGHLAARFGYRALDWLPPLAVVETGHNSSNLPGGPPMVELPMIPVESR